MKSFNLMCDQGHGFELMVKSAEALEEQQVRGLVTCPYCDSAEVTRTLTTPTVRGGKGRGQPAPHLAMAKGATGGPGPSQAELEKAYRALASMRAEVEKTHENVGTKFADQARAMHYGEIEERGIYGDATPSQVKDLVDEGVGIAPLPKLPKANA